MAPLGQILTAAAAASNLTARSFSYHDNAVRFWFPRDTCSTTATFTVTGLSISSGQDPSGYNKVGDVHHTQTIQGDPQVNTNFGDLLGGDKEPEGPEPGLVFKVGRHKTSQVADWWNGQIQGWQTTFNHNAGSLNFAFMGDLDYQITSNVKNSDGSTTEWYPATVPNVGFAQGSDDNGNNWWFGGPNCRYVGDDKSSRFHGQNVVMCHAHITGEPSAYLGDIPFMRGGIGQINDVFVLD